MNILIEIFFVIVSLRRLAIVVVADEGAVLKIAIEMGKYQSLSKINCFLNGMDMTSTSALFLMMVGIKVCRYFFYITSSHSKTTALFKQTVL